MEKVQYLHQFQTHHQPQKAASGDSSRRLAQGLLIWFLASQEHTQEKNVTTGLQGSFEDSFDGSVGLRYLPRLWSESKILWIAKSVASSFNLHVLNKKCCFVLFETGTSYTAGKKKADKRHIVLLVADLPQDQHKLRSRTSGFLDLDPPAIASAERSPKSQRDWKRKWPDSQLSVKLRPFRNIKRKQSVFFFSEKKLRSSRIRPPILALVDNPNLAEKQRPAQEDEIQRPTQSSGPTPELTP
jgi:hypothetical protein